MCCRPRAARRGQRTRRRSLLDRLLALEDGDDVLVAELVHDTFFVLTDESSGETHHGAQSTDQTDEPVVRHLELHDDGGSGFPHHGGESLVVADERHHADGEVVGDVTLGGHVGNDRWDLWIDHDGVRQGNLQGWMLVKQYEVEMSRVKYRRYS